MEVSDSADWIATWRPQTPLDGASNQIAITRPDAMSLVALLRHYDSRTVFIGYSMWRKLQLIFSNGVTSEVDLADRDSSDGGSTADSVVRQRVPLEVGLRKWTLPSHLAIAGAVSRAVELFVPGGYHQTATHLVRSTILSGEECHDFREFADGLISRGQVDVLHCVYRRLQLGSDFFQSSRLMGVSALHLAAGGGSKITLHFVLSALSGRDSSVSVGMVDFSSFFAEDVLRYAVRGNHHATVELIVRLGAKVNVPAFHTAVHQGAETVRLLLSLAQTQEPPFNIDVLYRGWAALHRATTPSVARILLEHGADIEIKDSYGEAPFSVALHFKRNDVARVLLENGAKHNLLVNVTNCIEVKNTDGLRLLVQHSTGQGDKLPVETLASTMHVASRSGNLEIVKLFIQEFGAPVDVRDDRGRSLLHSAARNAFEQEQLDVVHFLLRSRSENGGGLDVNVTDNQGRTALHSIAALKHINYQRLQKFLGKFVDLLLACGIDVGHKDHDGKTASDLTENDGLHSRIRAMRTKRGPGKKRKEEERIKAERGGGDHQLFKQGRFTVFHDRDHQLGVGGFGVVYKGFDNVKGVYVAVKESRLSGVSEEALKALKSEFELLQSLHHPNVVSVYGMNYDPESSVCQIYMQLMSSGSISSIIKANKFRLHENVILRYLLATLNGLVYLHDEKKIIHRDIKPGNILVDSDGVAKLSDFGSSKITSGFGGEAPTTSPVGTCVFMSPECIRGKFSQGSDIWALACTVIQMATGRLPWEEQNLTTPHAQMFHIGTAQPPNHHPPIPEHLSQELRDLIQTMFAFEPKSRSSARELRQHRCFAPLRPTASGLEPTGADSFFRTHSTFEGLEKFNSDRPSSQPPEGSSSSSSSSNKDGGDKIDGSGRQGGAAGGGEETAGQEFNSNSSKRLKTGEFPDWEELDD